MGSRGKTALVSSASTSRPLKGGVIKTPTIAGAATKKLPQVAAKSKAATAATSSSSSPKPGTAKPLKAQNPPPQAQPANPPAPAPAPTAAAVAPPLQTQLQPYNNNSNSSTIALPKASHANTSEELAGGVQDTIYLCNFRVSVDGEWLCLKELQDIDVANGQKTVGGGAALINTAPPAGAGHVQQRTQTNHQFGQRNSKRYSGISTGSAGTFEDNGIMAIENLIGRRLCDVVGSNALATAPQQNHKNVGLIGGTLAEWSHLCRLLLAVSHNTHTHNLSLPLSFSLFIASLSFTL